MKRGGEYDRVQLYWIRLRGKQRHWRMLIDLRYLQVRK